MQNPMAPTDKKDGLFLYLFILTVFFILLEISFFIQCNRFYLSDYELVTKKLMIPATVLPGLAFFLAAQLIVHLTFCIITWIIACLSARFFQLVSTQKVMFGIAIWMLGIFIVITANYYFYPNSKFSGLCVLFLRNRTISKIILISLISIYLFFIMLALFELFRLLGSRRWGIGALGLILIVCTVFYYPSPMMPQRTTTTTRPNLIVIGIDSVRPDFLGFFGHAINTPFLDTFLNQATVFNEAVTPLARTFPSWAAILTGEYPRQNGIRHDLATQTTVGRRNTLPKVLQGIGYETVFATDEVRFSNIDKNFGFDKIISPPMGLNDFLIGTFNDFPISNLIVNTKIGLWLFPHSYGNRPVHFTYDPDSFLQLVKPILEAPTTKPLFLAIHFCLPHTPYTWSEQSSRELNAVGHYEASIERVDKQIADFFDMLSSYHLLEHAIVVVLSDHGEGLEMPGDRLTEESLYQTNLKTGKKNVPLFYPPVLDHEGINQSAGHGTDVLGLTQYHTLLAFKLYGIAHQQNQMIPGLVSLIDIKPTLLSFLGINFAHLTGESLVAQILGKRSRVDKLRHIFIESDFSPEAIRTVYPDTRKVMLEGIQLFQIDPQTTRLVVKATMGEMIIHSKQFADIYREWMLALYPQNERYRMPILINLVSGEWTNDLNSIFALQSPAKEMLKALKLFYGNEINAVQMSDKETLTVR